MEKKLSHLNNNGQVNMVDVSAKSVSFREAVATGCVKMSLEALENIMGGNALKGDVISTAKIAGIMAAKQTANLIPLCHPLPLSSIKIDIQPDKKLVGYRISATVKTKAETGVEMEALTAVSVSALTLYDMAKAIEKSMVISEIKLVKKMGGKSGEFKIGN